ncbi:MAG: tetratricopeptide repeat protein, partial [Ginsengibacter sp.]
YANGYNGLANTFLNEKQYDSAKIYFNKAIGIDSKFVFGYLGIGNILYQQKLYDSAMTFYRAVVTLDPLNTNANTLLSACAYLKNDIDSSAYFLKQVLKKKIASQTAFNMGEFIANNYQQKKMYDKELDIARLLYNYDSVYNVPGVDSIQKRKLLNHLGYAYLYTGKLALSRFYYEKAGYLSYYYYNVACLASLDKKTKEALENLEHSFQEGYKDYDHLLEDTDLNNIRNTEEFKQLMKKYFPDKPGN